MSTTTEKHRLTCKNPDCAKEFIVIEKEAGFYAEKGLPLPDHCPACRHRQRMAMRSERRLYRRTCGHCKQPMLSVYPEEAPYVVYCHRCFWENIE